MERPSYRRSESGSAGRYHTPTPSPGPLYPTNFNVVRYGSGHKEKEAIKDTDSNADDIEIEEVPEVAPLVVKEVDLCVKQNTAQHHTYEYEITEDRPTGETPQLVIRRGQPFEVSIKVDRPYEKGKDRIQIHLEIGDEPKVSKGTEQRLPLRRRLEPRKWSTAIASSPEPEVLLLSVQAPPQAIVGRWRLYVETSLVTSPMTSANDEEDEERPTVRRYEHQELIYILFNPWCKEDQVYLADDVWRDEAVLNETGTMFTGNHRQVDGRPWNYGQFEDSILDCAMDLLDQTQLVQTVRHDPFRVVRAIASIVTGCESGKGVVEGSWAGKYKDGTAPGVWAGSVGILETYMDTKQPVKYGQCWVFAGVCTTLCRTLGIPARSVTNFSSAHDCDGMSSMDYHWTIDGMPLDDHNHNHVWSFHTWNEAWMARPELPTGYGGWQAFDATPQETSEGAQQAGPCSVGAIRDGYLCYPADGALFFSEVNADKVHWVQTEDATWWTGRDKAKVGKRISTKRPRLKKLAKSHNTTSPDDPDRMDITNHYKYKEDTEQERTSLYKGNLASCRPPSQKDPNDDVRFEFEMRDEVVVGNNFEVRLKMQNQSRHWRGLSVTLLLSTAYYTGVNRKQVKRLVQEVDIGPIKTEEVVLRVNHEEYQAHLVDQLSFKVKALATVGETGQIFTSEEDFRLRRPELNIQVPQRVVQQEEMSVTVKLINPLPVNLTGCTWRLEGAGIEKTRTEPQGDVEPYETAETTITLRPRRDGLRHLLVTFTANELADVTGSAQIEIEP